MTKSKILIGITLLTGSLSCHAQQSAKDVFAKMPLSFTPYLTDNDKLDMIDFVESGLKAEVRNKLGGKSVMTQLSADSLTVVLSETRSMTLQLLPVSEPVDSCQQVVRLTNVHGREIKEKKVEFFSVNWRKLDSEKNPTLK
mgnify:CR=1 FL=1